MSSGVNAQRCCDEYEDFRRHILTNRRTRRSFLMSTVGAIAAGAVAPNLLLNSALADSLAGVTVSGADPILVVIQLAGGNDGLNMMVPYGTNLYYGDRPNISVPADKVLHLDGMVGFNPNLSGLKPLYDAGKVAVVQGVGYPNPDLSHFRSTQIWESADPAGLSKTGWLGRWLDDTVGSASNPFTAVALGATVPMTLLSTRVPVTSIESVDRFRFLVSQNNSNQILQAFQQMYGPSKESLPPYIGVVRQAGVDAEQGVQDLHGITINYKSSVQYPNTVFARDLQLIAQMISSNLGTRIFHVTLGGFDDHVAEVYTHANLMTQLGAGLSAFYQDLQSMGKASQVTMVTFSEFGRRVRENAGRGTDHGTAAPMLVVGGNVKGGLYGTDPILSDLDSDGNLKYGIDFRAVYGTLIDGWLGGSSQTVLSGSFDRLSFI